MSVPSPKARPIPIAVLGLDQKPSNGASSTALLHPDRGSSIRAHSWLNIFDRGFA